MELIPYEQFAKLRLAQFYPDTSQLDPLDNWEFMGGIWVGEANAFTEFLRPLDRPDELGSIELDLCELPERIATTVLGAIHLPLRRGFSIDQVVRHLGPPEGTKTFVADRKSYDFTVGFRFRYYVSCTIQDSDGLIHVTVIRKDLLPGTIDA